MKIMNQSEVFQAMCELNKQWGILIVFPEEESAFEIIKACPWVDILDTIRQAWADGWCIALFDCEEEMQTRFKQIGVRCTNITRTRVYAETCDPNGQLLSTNT